MVDHGSRTVHRVDRPGSFAAPHRRGRQAGGFVTVPAGDRSASRAARRTTALLALVIGLCLPGSTTGRVSPPEYAKSDGIHGTLTAAGSDTMLELQTLMAEAFRSLYPQVKIQIEGKGSSTAPPALIEGTVQLGNMSRRMKPSERDAFEARFGYEPLCFDIAVDSLVIVVHRDNPLCSLTLEQVDAIFSMNRLCGGLFNVRTWGGVGLDGAWRKAPISLYGRNAASGTYGYFKKLSLIHI